MSAATGTECRVNRFRLAVSRAKRTRDDAVRLAAVIEHLEGWADATATTLHEGEAAVYVLVVPRRPVRLQAAKDIAATCPCYVAKSFKVLG